MAYLAVVLVLCTRLVVGWALSEKLDAELVIKALDMAYEQRGRPQGRLFHSDKYRRLSYSTQLPAVGLIPAQRWTKRCWL